MSLLYNVAQLLKSEVGQTRTFDFAGVEPISLGDGVATDVHGQVKLTLTNFGVLARGEADASLQVTCARCLEPCQTPTHITFEEEYQPTIDVVTGLPSSTPRNDNAFAVGRSHVLDLTEALRQNLVLALEMIPLCRPDCRGLCPNCGANRNTDPCTCPTPESTSPFAALDSLLSNTNCQT